MSARRRKRALLPLIRWHSAQVERRWADLASIWVDAMMTGRARIDGRRLVPGVERHIERILKRRGMGDITNFKAFLAITWGSGAVVFVGGRRAGRSALEQCYLPQRYSVVYGVDVGEGDRVTICTMEKREGGVMHVLDMTQKVVEKPDHFRHIPTQKLLDPQRIFL